MSAINRKILEWTPEYSVHDTDIDGEHRKWIGAVNRLHQAMLAGKGTEVLGPLLDEMTRYTAYHFARETKLMAAAHYPDLRAHVQQHNELRRRVKAFVARFESGESTITIELTLFLSEWIRQHILTTDRRFGEYLTARRKVTADRILN